MTSSISKVMVLIGKQVLEKCNMYIDNDFNKFTGSIWERVGKSPKNWRQGQKVFNAVESLYGSVAREVQFQDGVDCFYDDNMIDEFLKKVWNRLK